MKNKLFILLILVLTLGSCYKDTFEIYDYPIGNTNIFDIEGSVIQNGDEFEINVNQSGTYKISLTDEFTNQTITNENFDVKVGSNKLNIHTKILPKGSYILEIKNEQNKTINQTTIRL